MRGHIVTLPFRSGYNRCYLSLSGIVDLQWGGLARVNGNQFDDVCYVKGLLAFRGKCTVRTVRAYVGDDVVGVRDRDASNLEARTGVRVIKGFTH
jgi:hypothetical protein